MNIDTIDTQLNTEKIVKVLRELDSQLCLGKVDFQDATIRTTQQYEPDYAMCRFEGYSPSVKKTRREIEITVRVSTYD